VIEDRKNQRKKETIHYNLRFGYVAMVNQIVMTTVVFL